MDIIEKANNIYLDNFPNKTCFERAIFFSWYCSIRDCTFCYMSTQNKQFNPDKIPRRTTESILAEVFLSKKLGWDLGFFSGGINAYTNKEFLDVVKKVNYVYNDKIWVNVGPLSKKELISLKPYIKGVVGSIETINPKIHSKVCPSKPMKPYEKMYVDSLSLNLKTSLTIILGLGETINDFNLLKEFIKKYKISKVHFYGLNPHKGTLFENSLPPSMEYQAEWIARTRLEFPKIDIQLGIWLDRVDRVSLLLNSGANSISKFPATSKFGSKEAYEIERQAKLAGREFQGTLTKLPDIDWDKEVDKLTELDKDLRERIKIKLHQYIKTMAKKKV